ncbi:zinc finger protein 385D-like isoform X2 [Lampris incognitus]|nr:zinc finger protein 385D-like isoform X2 [Lampris incognitus]
MCQAALPPLARHAPGRAPPSTDLKPLLPFRLLPRFNEMDHTHKVLIGPSFGLAAPLKRRSSSCGVCRLRFNSEVQASPLHSGARYAKRLKTSDAPDAKIGTSEPVAKETTSRILSSPCSQPCSSDTAASGDSPAPPAPREMEPSSSGSSEAMLKTSTDPPPSPSPRTEKDRQGEREGEAEAGEETEEAKAIRLLYCSLCKVAVNSASQLQAHNSGTKHKTMLEARSGDGAIKSFPRSGVKAKLAAPSEASTGLQNKTFHCEICDVHVNSETQLKQHISSRRHKDRAAGKPAKPKFSPYNPTPRQQSLHAVRLALRKEQDLTKPLASCLIQRQLSVAAAAAMASLSPFHLRPTSGSSPALFQPRPLPQALLHPGPGPICSTHTPVLFAPY